MHVCVQVEEELQVAREEYASDEEFESDDGGLRWTLQHSCAA